MLFCSSALALQNVHAAFDEDRGLPLAKPFKLRLAKNGSKTGNRCPLGHNIFGVCLLSHVFYLNIVRLQHLAILWVYETADPAHAAENVQENVAIVTSIEF